VLADAGLPHLEAALDPAAIGPRLSAVLGEHGPVAAQVLKRVPGKRCVLAYCFADGTRVVGKMYRKNRAVAQATHLAAASSALRGGTRVPRLFACWEDLGLVLQEWAPGEPAPDYEALAGKTALVEQLGAALAELHLSGLDAGPPADLEAHVRRTCKPGSAALAAAVPDLAAALHTLEAAMYSLERSLGRTLRPCHGDFSPRQVFVAPHVVTLVDLDGMSRSDAALDVANFRVGLEAHLGVAGRQLGQRFLAAYLGSSGLESLPALPAYEAFSELRRAMILWRKRPPGWETDLHRGLRRGCARLTTSDETGASRSQGLEGNR
jgi:Ser/Thr protein kinase RdoA (MazF antagonist)